MTGEIRPAREGKVAIAGERVGFVDAPGAGERIASNARSEDDEVTEMVVPVKWDIAVREEEAISAQGLFASQVTVCKLRDERTIDFVERGFGLIPTDALG